VDKATGSTILSETKLDSRRLALKHAARKGEAQEGPNNPSPHVAKDLIEMGRFA
jgi:hypothetical protein